MTDRYRKICKLVLKLDFKAHSKMEPLSEFGLRRREKSKKSVTTACCVRTPMPREENAKKLPANITN